MKDFIISKLEEQSWLTPGALHEALKGDTSIPMGKKLSLRQVTDIVKSWRAEMNFSNDSYVENNPYNAEGLPFLRLYMTYRYTREEALIHYKVIIWTSNFQLNRLRMVSHLYIDGTFVVVPHSYKQLIVISIRDPNTDKVFPAAFALINTKEEEGYFLLLKHLKELATEFDIIEWNLTQATIDFEEGLQTAFKRVFPKTSIIGCLFHFRQALFRQASNRKLLNNDRKDVTQKLIDSLSHLSWSENIPEYEAKFNQIKLEYMNQKDLIEFIQYFEENWIPRFKSGQTHYSDKDDRYRSNSVLESYNSYIKDKLPRSPSWPEFLEFLKGEDKRYVNDVYYRECKATISTKSRNFGQAFNPLRRRRKQQTKPKSSNIETKANSATKGYIEDDEMKSYEIPEKKT